VPAQAGQVSANAAEATLDPIGTSHFESNAAMTVPRGTSAMVSILEAKTDGEGRLLLRPGEPARQRQLPVQERAHHQPDRRRAGERSGHRLRRRALHRRGDVRAHPGQADRVRERATVYIRHSVAPGYRITKAPNDPEHVGSAYLYRVEIEPFGKLDVDIEESTPVFKTTDIRSTGGMELVRVVRTAGQATASK
jgi:hypothetical protein